MAICYFDKDYDVKYQCRYTIQSTNIEVEVDYDIKDEIEVVDGVKIFYSNMEYKKISIIYIFRT